MQARELLCGVLLASGVAAQSAWYQRTVPNPPAVSGLAMVFDSVRQVVVLHRDQTWEWDGTNWTQRNLAVVPSSRQQFAMAFDRTRGVTVLHGGDYHGDTWEYDGNAWRQVPTMGGPGVRCCAAMTYDWFRQRVLLFGGYSGSQMLDDTWEWDGTTWTQMNPTTRPSPRCCGDMVFDLGRGVTVMFGGALGASGGDTDETWVWDGLDWRLLMPPVAPPARRGLQYLEYDLLRGRVLLHGGGVGGGGTPRFNDAWEFDGQIWTARQPPSPPTASWLFGMAFDEARAELVRNGGLLAGGGNQTWVFTAATGASFGRYGNGCTGSAGLPQVMAVAGLPWLGQPFTLAMAPVRASTPAVLAVGRSNIVWNGVPLPLSLAAAGMPGCSLQASAEFFVPLTTLAGRATWNVTFPNDPALVGASIFVQGFAYDPGVNALGLVASDGGALTFGML
jgi:hypothetical protein